MPECILVNLNWHRLAHSTRFNPSTPVLPLELGYIASGLKHAGISVDVLDLWALNAEMHDFTDVLANAKVLIVNSAPAYVYWRCCPLDLKVVNTGITELRVLNKHAKIILIGPHGTVKPETFYNSEADFIIRGEPELAACELVGGILHKMRNTHRAVCYKKNGKWIGGKETTVAAGLDSLPVLDYGFFEVERYAIHNGPPNFTGKGAIYEASRGCPFDCIYCFRAGFRKQFRKKGIARIARELKALKGQGVGFVYLIDECFAVDKAWAEKVCMELGKANIEWSCMTRPEILEKNLIDTMAGQGCTNICLGVESANREILSTIGKRNTDLAMLEGDINYMIKAGIQPWLFLMIGSPKETAKTLGDSLKFLSRLELKNVSVSFGLMLPYPETWLWKMAEQQYGKLSWDGSIKYSGTIGNSFTQKSARRAMLLFGYKLGLIRLKQAPNLKNLRAILPATAEFAIKYAFPEKNAKNSGVFALLKSVKD